MADVNATYIDLLRCVNGRCYVMFSLDLRKPCWKLAKACLPSQISSVLEKNNLLANMAMFSYTDK